MTLLVRHKFAHYRRYELDIGGVCFNDARAINMLPRMTGDYFISKVKSPYFKFFFKIGDKRRKLREYRKQRYVYRLDMLPPDRPRRKFNQRFLSIRLTRLYFITLQDHQFRSMFKKATKLDGNMQDNYLHLLEGRVLMILYRTLFVSNIFEAIRCIKLGIVYVDTQPVLSYNFLVPVAKFMHLSRNYVRRVQLYVSIRAKGSAVLFNSPKFMFISFKFIMAVLLRYPHKKELVYPINIDIQRITGYY